MGKLRAPGQSTCRPAVVAAFSRIILPGIAGEAERRGARAEGNFSSITFCSWANP